MDVNDKLISIGIRRLPPIKFGTKNKPRFKVGPDGKLDPASIQKLLNIVSEPQPVRNLLHKLYLKAYLNDQVKLLSRQIAMAIILNKRAC